MSLFSSFYRTSLPGLTRWANEHTATAGTEWATEWHTVARVLAVSSQHIFFVSPTHYRSGLPKPGIDTEETDSSRELAIISANAQCSGTLEPSDEFGTMALPCSNIDRSSLQSHIALRRTCFTLRAIKISLTQKRSVPVH